MKTLKILVSFCIILLLFAIAGCKGPINQIDEQYDAFDLKKSTLEKLVELTQDEIDGILLMREEEKLARDVYVQLYAEYPQQTIFLNISESEQRHMDAMLDLIEFYELDDPASDSPGVFNNDDLQVLYDNLMSSAVDLVSALEVGVEIEETDIEDISNLMAETEVKNLDQVYSNLLRGSENHLKSFEKVLEKLEKKLDK